MPFDFILFANKNVRSSEATVSDAIRSAVQPATVLVSLQNGIHVEQPLKNTFTQNTVLSAICYLSCQQTGPGLVQQVSQIRSHAFHIGVFGPKSADIEAEAWKVQDLTSLDPKFREVKDINTERWIKVVVNGSWNPVAALTGCDTHQILQRPSSLALVQRLAEEMYQVALKTGVDLPQDLPQTTLNSTARASSFVPSVLQDVRKGREMEIEALCGIINP